MWQEIAIYIIGIAAVLYSAWKLYRYFTRPKDENTFCPGCSGCKLKDECKKININKK